MPLRSRTYPLHRWFSVYRTIVYQYIRPSTVATFTTLIQRQRANREIAMLLLIAERSNGTLEDISEEELYRYTRNRWIHNESVQLSERYLKFDLQQLLKAAVIAVSSEGARYCTRVLKCREGLNNKAYLLTMDNGSEVFAKLPNPIAGSAYYTTASEVATREFLRDVLNIPTPQYILEEKAPGKPLGSLWYQWPMKFKLEMISQIVEIERQLTSTKFVKSGCIYFRDDIPEDMSSDNAIITSVPLHSSVLERVMATNEMRFIKTHARICMNYHRSSTEPELPEEVLDLLNRYLQLAPAMVPPLGAGDTHSPTLWHPDLHLDNQITRIIDWQSAAVMPFLYQCGVPRMFLHPVSVADGWALSELLEDYDSLDQSEKAKIDSDRKSETYHKYYEAETKSKNPRHWAALRLENPDVRTEPSRLTVNVWEGRDVFFLRRALMSIVEQWQDLRPESALCPVSFNEQELALHAAEEESMSNVSEILRPFRENWGLPPNGMVDPTEFDQIRTAVAELRNSFIGMLMMRRKGNSSQGYGRTRMRTAKK
ncbi:hypothetical protein BJ875DRAFT_533605 [Amylocarpus encephaloides]|uniref:Altered inheritance of mitochondria protein 9, mitochondrial n=1 Tax=Amylocarpus encephaloides TaxID=45428 RepID=A0A9P7YNA4_9HELO|nr:hypothetical protein BJ875DRAFT_533605 [Amylocarpus encephaloides]